MRASEPEPRDRHGRDFTLYQRYVAATGRKPPLISGPDAWQWKYRPRRDGARLRAMLEAQIARAARAQPPST